MKKLLALFLTIATVFALSACTPDKSSQETPNTPIEQTINLDNCYVCPIYFNGEDHYNMQISGDEKFTKDYLIKGYYIENDVIKEYDLATYRSGGVIEYNYWAPRQGLVAEYHGITSYVIYIWELVGSDHVEFLWTWGEYKQILTKYNALMQANGDNND